MSRPISQSLESSKPRARGGANPAPLLVLGPGRCGSTLLFELLALHPDLAWPSNLTGRLVGLPQLALLSRVNEIGTLGRRASERRYWPRPVERYRVWEHYAPGLSRGERPTRPIADREAEALRGWAAAHVRWQGKERMLIKYTGYSRLEFMRSVFGEASFVSIDRDPRAVVYSLSQKGWTWDDTDPRVLAGLDRMQRLDYYSRQYMSYFRVKASCQPGAFLQVFYERLVEDPVACVRRACEHAGVRSDPAFEQAVRSRPLRRQANAAFRRGLSPAELELLEQRLDEPLSALGYR